MPQLDIGVLFLELVLNFMFFWSLYIYYGKFVLPIINKALKLRYYKLKKITTKLYLFEKKIIFIIKLNYNNLFNVNLLLNNFVMLINYKVNVVKLILLNKIYKFILNYFQIYINVIKYNFIKHILYKKK